MSEVLPVLYMARHGDTAWSLSGQHTGLTDLPLTPDGERNARRLGRTAQGHDICQGVYQPIAARVPEPVNWPGLEPWPKPILIWWNGTTVNMKVGARPRSLRSAQTGNCSGTAVREANRQHRWRASRPRGPARPQQFRETYCSFPADTSFGCWPRAGWRSVRDRRAGTFCLTRRA